MSREFLDYIEDIIDAMASIGDFVAGCEYEDFAKDKKTNYSVIRALEIVGEAVKKVPAEVRNQYPQIPWKDMAGMRDKLIHDYFGVNLEVVWKTIEKDLPVLRPLFEKILNEYSKSE